MQIECIGIRTATMKYCSFVIFDCCAMLAIYFREYMEAYDIKHIWYKCNSQPCNSIRWLKSHRSKWQAMQGETKRWSQRRKWLAKQRTDCETKNVFFWLLLLEEVGKCPRHTHTNGFSENVLFSHSKCFECRCECVSVCAVHLQLSSFSRIFQGLNCSHGINICVYWT